MWPGEEEKHATSTLKNSRLKFPASLFACKITSKAVLFSLVAFLRSCIKPAQAKIQKKKEKYLRRTAWNYENNCEKKALQVSKIYHR